MDTAIITNSTPSVNFNQSVDSVNNAPCAGVVVADDDETSAPCNYGMTATYSPEDNKLRLYSVSRLDAETYARVKSAGFIWAPKQGLFVAPAWTPGREDLLLELCGEIDDEDKSLVKRAEDRAERFEDYSEKRLRDAERARQEVQTITDFIPFGQPILVGHHSERRARRDAERIENGMRKAVRMWETSTYWTERAAGAIRHAKYKERPDVRYRRIKTLEAEARKYERANAECESLLKFWRGELSARNPTTGEKRKIEITEENRDFLCQLTGRMPSSGVSFRGKNGENWYSAYDCLQPEGERYQNCPDKTVAELQEAAIRMQNNSITRNNRWMNHFRNRIAYERAMLGEQGGVKGEQFDLQPGGMVLVQGEWLTIVRVNKKDGHAVSVTTNSRYVRVKGIELIKDYQPPTEEAAAKVKAATKLPPICNYPGEGFAHITKAEWERRYKDSKGTDIVKASETVAAHRVRYFVGGNFGWSGTKVFITDEKVKYPPKPEAVTEAKLSPADLPKTTDLETLTRQVEAIEARRETEAAKAEAAQPFTELRDALKTGIQVVSAPQLFPTPPELAARLIELADVENRDVLEPSAGTGNLADACRKAGARSIDCVEINLKCQEILRLKCFHVRTGDFLAASPDTIGQFDRIVMNPPFENSADIKHIRHALNFLRPGGKLVAICANGPRQREQLMPLADYWEDLPPGSFSSQGTNVNTALLAIEKPDAC